MKKIFTFLFLIFFSFLVSSHAENIRNFQIEGISLGDSLLDHFSKKMIQNNKTDYYNNDKFTVVEFRDKSLFKNYDGVQIHYKTKGNKYIIYALDFVLEFENNFNKCFKKQDQIVNDLSDTFASVVITKKNVKHPEDKSGNSKVTSVFFDFDSRDYASVDCYNWSDKMGYPDQLRVSLTLRELSDWLNIPNIYK